MCESTSPGRTRDLQREAGERRLILLLQWIAADRSAQDDTFATSLGLWRDEVACRLPAGRPQVIRIPLCLCKALTLASQKVYLDEGNALYEVLSGSGRNVRLGRQLLAANDA